MTWNWQYSASGLLDNQVLLAYDLLCISVRYIYEIQFKMVHTKTLADGRGTL
jgi:hypothetical protein